MAVEEVNQLVYIVLCHLCIPEPVCNNKATPNAQPVDSEIIPLIAHGEKARCRLQLWVSQRPCGTKEILEIKPNSCL